VSGICVEVLSVIVTRGSSALIPICNRRFEKGGFFNWVDGVGFLIGWPAPTTVKADPCNSGFTAFSANRSRNSSQILSRHKKGVEKFL
jgi:hypothetical protein